MPCKCKMKNVKVGIEVRNENMTSITKIHPFETCPYCAAKHMSYALVKLNEDNDQLRYIGQVYLAYKHLEKYFINEAKLCFELITDFFQDKIYQDKIENVVNIIHNYFGTVSGTIISGRYSKANSVYNIKYNIFDETSYRQDKYAAGHANLGAGTFNYEGNYYGKELPAEYIHATDYQAKDVYTKEMLEEAYSEYLTTLE